MTLCLSGGHLRSPPASSLMFHDSMTDCRYDSCALDDTGRMCFMIVILCLPQKTPGPGKYNWSDSVFGQPRPLPAAVLHLKKKHGITVS